MKVIPEVADKRGSTAKGPLKVKHDNVKVTHQMLFMEPPTIPTAPTAVNDVHVVDEDELLLDTQVGHGWILYKIEGWMSLIQAMRCLSAIGNKL